MRAGLVLIENDVFGICGRVRGIDPAYYIVYNTALRRFEVHNRRQRDTLALVVPYGALDARTVSLTQKTRRENIAKLIKEMEEANMKLEAGSDKNIMDRARGRFGEALSRAGK